MLATAFVAAHITTFAQSLPAKNNDASAFTERQVTSFSSVRIQGPFDVYVTQATEESVKLDAPAEILDRIVTQIKGSELNIHNKHDNWGWGINSWWSDKSWWHTHKRVAVYITLKNVNAISVSGSGHLIFDQGIAANGLKLNVHGSGQIQGAIDVKTLKGRISGSSYIKLSGKAESSNFKISGSGHFSARDLATLSSTVRVSGSGHADIQANEKLDAVVHGSAHVSYSGAATMINASKSGSGSVSRM